jgi:hypothetical protein
MKLIVTYRARGQEFCETVEGTRAECDEGVRAIIRRATAAVSFTTREVPEIDVKEAMRPLFDSQRFPDNHRDGLD